MRLLRSRFVPTLIIFTVLIAGCTSWTAPKTQVDRTKALLAFGTTLDAGGNLFVGAGTSYNSALDAGMITPEQYRKWSNFATPFKPAYDKAVTSWKLARSANNLNSMEDVKTQMGPLLVELATFALSITQINTAK